jgi:hypothetical protein
MVASLAVLRVRSADCAMLETWSVRLLEAAFVEEVLR